MICQQIPLALLKMASKTEPLPTISSAATPFRHHHPSPARLLTGLLASALAHTYSPQASCVRPSHSPAQNLPVAPPAIRIKVKSSFCAIHSPSPFQPPPGPSACSLAPALRLLGPRATSSLGAFLLRSLRGSHLLQCHLPRGHSLTTSPYPTPEALISSGCSVHFLFLYCLSPSLEGQLHGSRG